MGAVQFLFNRKVLLMSIVKNIETLYLGMEESGQPRWFWEPEQAVMAGASSNLAIQTTFKNI